MQSIRKRIKQPKALLISIGVYLTFFTVSVNGPERYVQATELHEGQTLSLYLLGGLTHAGLGLDVLDGSGKFVGIRVWDFGSRNHYGYKDEEWITGKRNWFGSLNNLSLLEGDTAGEMRAWDPAKRFGMSLEEFRRSSRVKARLPITKAQWERINAWLHEQTKTFAQHHSYAEQGLDIWFEDGITYNLFAFNCATFIAQALFAGSVYTADNLPKVGQVEPVPSRWWFPPNLIAHYRVQPLLNEEMIRRKIGTRQRKRSCLQLQQVVPTSIASLAAGVCLLG